MINHAQIRIKKQKPNNLDIYLYFILSTVLVLFISIIVMDSLGF